jgi:hypothetical protein
MSETLDSSLSAHPSSPTPLEAEPQLDGSGDLGNGEYPIAPAPDKPVTKQSRIISHVLSPAIRLWLRAQLEHVEDLQFTIEAGDRQLLSGAIPRVVVAASKAVYQGLHLSCANLVAEKIQINLGQILRGHSLQLQAAFPIRGNVRLDEADLNTSLRSPLLAGGIRDFLLILLQEGLEGVSAPLPDAATLHLENTQIQLHTDRLILATTLLEENAPPRTIVLETGFRLEQGNLLRLSRPQRLPHLQSQEGIPLNDLDGYTFDLGSEVCLEEMKLEAGRVVCRGQVWVTPG